MTSQPAGASGSSTSICSGWLAAIMGPFHHSTQPRTRKRLPGSCARVEPRGLEAGQFLPLDRDGEIAAPVRREVHIDELSPFADRVHPPLDELIAAGEPAQILWLLRRPHTISPGAPQPSPRLARLILDSQKLSNAGPIVRAGVDAGDPLPEKRLL